MKQIDVIQRFIFEEVAIRGEWVRLTESYRQVLEQHQYPPEVKRLVGQMLVISALLTATLKFKGNLSVQFQGKGGLKLLLAQCNDQFHVRGLAQWEESFDVTQLESQFQQGLMVITIDPDVAGSRYQGMVEWEGHSLAESIEGYFRRSEQLPTRLWLAVNDEVASGLLLQTLPALEQQSEQKTEHGWEHAVILADTITQEELLSLDAKTILHRLFSEDTIRLFEPVDVLFQCKCSVSRCENALRIAGEAEIREELKEKQVVDVTCEFCSKTYTFDREAVNRIFSDDEPRGTLH